MGTDSENDTTIVLTSCLFDSDSLQFLRNRDIVIDNTNGLIRSVFEHTTSPPASRYSGHVLDLRGDDITILPGLIDVHTHLFLHPYSESSNDHQRVFEGLLERTIRATVHARHTLEAGFTTVRDLGTESALDADISLRNSIEAGVIPGPRILAASQAIVSTGTYEPPNTNYEGGTRVPPGGDVGDGVEGCRKAVRRRLGVGADVIKIYADYPRLRPQRTQPGSLHPPHCCSSPSSSDLPCFTPPELSTIVSEANLARTPVAAHVKPAAQILACIEAGVHTIEHGYGSDTACFSAMKRRGAIWVPTLAAVRTIYGHQDERYTAIVRTFQQGLEAGVKIAAGGDTGVFAHGDNALEMQAMVEAGMSVEQALQAATLHGWQACGGEESTGRRFGCIREGFVADLVAVRGKLDGEHFARTIRDVVFVAKNGEVFKHCMR